MLELTLSGDITRYKLEFLNNLKDTLKTIQYNILYTGNRRESGGSTGSNYSTQHLSPPDLSVRRFYSDPSLHQTVNGVQQLSSQDHTAPVSDICGSQTIVPTQINEHLNPNIGFGTSLGGLSPLQNASPTISRRGK